MMQNGHGRESGGCVELGLAETPCFLLYANFTALSSIRPKLFPIKVFSLREEGISPNYCEKWSKISFFVRTAKLIDMIPKHISWPIIDCFSMDDTMGSPIC